MKRKTQIERAIEQLEGELAILQRDHDAKVAGVRSAIAVLRDQKTRTPKRRSVAVPAEGRPA